MAEEQYSELANYEFGVKKNLVIIRNKKAESETSDDEKVICEVQKEHDDTNDCCSDPLQRIVHGFNHFLSNKFNKYPCLFNELAKTQNPKFLVFSCSDSRVNPSHFLNFQPGEAFMARNIGNLIPIYNTLKYSGVGAIIEYAVTHLEVENILVIGHSSCGGIEALMSDPVGSDFIDDWVNIAQIVKNKVKAEYSNLSPEEQRKICTEEAVNLSLKNLNSYPFVLKRVEEKKITLRGGYYHFGDGSLKLWELE
ncbi:hypothetical protein CsatB_017937 [Cannabis sativa]